MSNGDASDAFAALAVMTWMAPPVVHLAIGHHYKDLGAIFCTQLLCCMRYILAGVLHVACSCNDHRRNSLHHRCSSFDNSSSTIFAAGAALELRQQHSQAAKRLNALVQIAIVFVAKHGGCTIATGARHVRMGQQLASGFI